jgi:hypothetical protein
MTPLPSNYKPATKDCSQQLRYQFNNDELIERGKKLSETHSKYAQLENDKKRVVTDFTAKMTAVKAEASSLAEMVSTGYELRDIPCTATMDTPTIGKKRITRNDTSEEVSIEPMTPSENGEAQDARAKAEYDLANPVLELDAPNKEVKTEEEHTEAANEAANPENTLPAAKEGEGEALSTEEQAELTGGNKKKKGKGKASSPGDDF